jgi:hypothetical protein
MIFQSWHENIWNNEQMHMMNWREMINVGFNLKNATRQNRTVCVKKWGAKTNNSTKCCQWESKEVGAKRKTRSFQAKAKLNGFYGIVFARDRTGEPRVTGASTVHLRRWTRPNPKQYSCKAASGGFHCLLREDGGATVPYYFFLQNFKMHTPMESLSHVEQGSIIILA